MNTNSNRRPAFPFRPWITGKAYDDMARVGVLHCDAFVFGMLGLKYLVIDWRESGRKPVALDGYLIEPDGLTRIWEPSFIRGIPIYWTRESHSYMRHLHQRVLSEVRDVRASPRWSAVSFQAHYVFAGDADCEIKANAFKPPKPYAPRVVRNKLPDIL